MFSKFFYLFYIKVRCNMKKIRFELAINISSNSDEWCNLSMPLFDLERHVWFNDGSTHYYGKDFDKIALELEDRAIALAGKVEVSQLNELAKEAKKHGWASIELFSKSFDDDFFSGTVSIEAIAEDVDED